MHCVIHGLFFSSMWRDKEENLSRAETKMAKDSPGFGGPTEPPAQAAFTPAYPACPHHKSCISK